MNGSAGDKRKYTQRPIIRSGHEFCDCNRCCYLRAQTGNYSWKHCDVWLFIEAWSLSFPAFLFTFSYLRASSCEPGRSGCLGFRHLGSPLFSSQKFRCVHMRRRAVLGNRTGNFSHMNTPARPPGLSGTKHFQLRMACKVTDKSERASTGILGAFWTFFISVTGIKFPI